MAIIHLNSDNFEKETKESTVIIDFFADWCVPCNMMAPVFEGLSEEYPDLKFCKLNTEEEPKIAAEYNVMGIPCLIILSNGKETGRIVGALSKEELKARIDEILSKS